jgi:hypothetical protein
MPSMRFFAVVLVGVERVRPDDVRVDVRHFGDVAERHAGEQCDGRFD